MSVLLILGCISFLFIGIVGFKYSGIAVGLIFTLMGVGLLIGAIVYIVEDHKLNKWRLEEQKNPFSETNLRKIDVKIAESTLKRFNRKITDEFYIDDNKKIMAFVQYNNVVNHRLYRYSDLLDFELIENGEKVNVSSEQHGTVGRAIVGGALFGVTGAIVGASTAPTTSSSTTTIDEMYINAYMANGKVEKIHLCFETNKNSQQYRDSKYKASQIIAALNSIKYSNSQ